MSLESKLLSLSQRGIFPGPSESSIAFFSRADSLSAKEITGYSGSMTLMNKIYSTSPDWIETIVSSKGLSPWEGAAVWIEEKPEVGRTCQIQIKNSFLARLYPQDEVVAHEMVHAMRLMFDENHFEEILAYRTSKNRFRRYFGPLFSSPKESKFFLILLLGSWLCYWAEIIFDLNLGGEWILALPMLALGFGVFRLWRSQRIFSAALRNLKNAIDQSANPLAAALRLTDNEIEQFAKSSPQEIQAFAAQQKEQDVRWKQIFLHYFSDFK